MYLWNAGMFVILASTYLKELTAHDPTMADLTRRAWEQADRNGPQVVLDAEVFGQITGSSIDYTVMERTDMAAVVPTDPGWNDVGSWASLWDIAQHDSDGNVISGDVIAVDVKDSYVRGGERLVAVVGIEDIIVVDTKDATLITTRDRAQDVKQVVDRLASENRTELETNGTVLHAWGGLRTVGSGPGYRALHVWLDPGQETPIQVNEKKHEHWQVLRGVARVTVDGAAIHVPERESVYIPPGSAHRLANEGDGVLEVVQMSIDVQIDSDVIAQFLKDNGIVGGSR
jgi:mannose-1-phosphate guanylyltransferase/mannose-6-phosphate isomerase